MITDQGPPAPPAAVARLHVSSNGFVTLDSYAEPCWESTLSAQYKSFVVKVNKCRDLSGYQRMRSYGAIGQDHRHVIVLATEFCQRKDYHQFWRDLERARVANSAHLWIMQDSDSTEPASIPTYRQYADADGFNGQPFYHVQLSWRIETMKYRQIQDLIDHLQVTTQDIWGRAGIVTLF